MNQWTKLSCKEKKLPFPVNQVLPLEETAEKPTALQRQSPLTHQESPRLWGTLGGGQKNRFAKWWKKKRSRQWLPHLELYWLFPPISLTNSSWFGALIGRLYHLSLFKDLILSVYVCVYVSIHLCICTCTCVTARRVCWVFCSWGTGNFVLLETGAQNWTCVLCKPEFNCWASSPVPLLFWKNAWHVAMWRGWIVEAIVKKKT